MLKVQVRKVVQYPRLVATVFAGNRVITHGAIVPKVGLQSIRLANYVQYLPKGTRLSVTFGPSSGSADVAYLGFADEQSISLGAGGALAPGPDEADQRMRKAFVALAVCTVLVPAALAGGTPGVTSSTITIGGTVPITGPAALFGSVGRGADAYFKYVNAHGGVNGRKINYVYLDDGYDPSKTVLLTRQLVEQDHVFAIFNSVGTDNNLAIRDYLNAAKVPQLFGGTGAAKIGDGYKTDPWSMGYLPSFRAEGVIYGRSIAKLPSAKVGRPLRGLRVRQGHDRRAEEGPRYDTPRRSSSAQAYEPTDTTIDSQMSTLHASGANVLVLNTTPQYAILAYVAAHKLGWNPQDLRQLDLHLAERDGHRPRQASERSRTARCRLRSSRTRPTRFGRRIRW